MKIELKASIIAPVYNAEHYLKKCLDSVIHQSYTNLEIILVNDGSTDSSPKIIDKYAAIDKRIIVIHKENGGIGSAYKAAFEVMSGDYVLFVDSDDWLELDAVEHLVKLATENEADIVSLGIRAFNPAGEEVNLSSFKNIDLIITSNKEILKNHFEVLKHPTLARLFKRELFKDIVIFEQNIGIDEMLTPQLLAKCNRAVYTSKEFYNVFLRENSVCRAEYNERKIMETIKVYRFICSFMEEKLQSFAPIMHNKYLVVLSGIFHLLLLNRKPGYNGLSEEIIEEIKEVSKKAKNISSLSENYKGRIRLFLIIRWPEIYKYILNLKLFFQNK